MRKYLILVCFLSLSLGGFFLYQRILFFDGKLHAVVCNVGQGDAIFVRTPTGEDILVDGGPDDSVLNCLGNHMPFWDRDLELVILTHPHVDHLTGLISVLKRYDVMHYATEKVENGGSLLKKLQDALAAKKLTANYLSRDDRIELAGQLSLSTLWPDANTDYLKVDSKTTSLDLDLNGFCLIELLRYKNFTMLITGDAGADAEEKANKATGSIDVLKVPHHGSKTGTSQIFLDEIKPKLAVISVGKNNRYGHPAQETLQLFTNNQIPILRTDQNGEVEIISDGRSFEYKVN